MGVAVNSAAQPARWELYRILAEPVRLRLLALCGEEELTIGELAELLGDPQPKVSRHLKLLRESGLVAVRRQGTRTLVRLAGTVTADPVISDALSAGYRLVEADGSLKGVPKVLMERDRAVRAFFEQGEASSSDSAGDDMPAYLTLLAPLLPARDLAVDVGTGTGALLEVLAPVFTNVIAVDRSRARLHRAEERTQARGYANVTFHCCDYVSETLQAAVGDLGGADAVFASRLLHHASRPKDALRSLAALCRPGGTLLLMDYGTHHDERLREEQADLWLGFEASELAEYASKGGLEVQEVLPIPRHLRGSGPDCHLPWQLLVATRPKQTRSPQHDGDAAPAAFPSEPDDLKH